MLAYSVQIPPLIWTFFCLMLSVKVIIYFTFRAHALSLIFCSFIDFDNQHKCFQGKLLWHLKSYYIVKLYFKNILLEGDSIWWIKTEMFCIKDVCTRGYTFTNLRATKKKTERFTFTAAWNLK